MEQASNRLDFEAAARYRDQIQAVRSVMEKQFVSNDRLDDIDIIAIAYKSGLACVQKCCLFVTEKYWEIAVISRKFRKYADC